MHEDAVQMHSDTLKVPRRCATVAANKIKIMSNLKEMASVPDNVRIRRNSRKLPYRHASAAAKKKLLSGDLEDGARTHSRE